MIKLKLNWTSSFDHKPKLRLVISSFMAEPNGESVSRARLEHLTEMMGKPGWRILDKAIIPILIVLCGCEAGPRDGFTAATHPLDPPSQSDIYVPNRITSKLINLENWNRQLSQVEALEIIQLLKNNMLGSGNKTVYFIESLNQVNRTSVFLVSPVHIGDSSYVTNVFAITKDPQKKLITLIRITADYARDENGQYFVDKLGKKRILDQRTNKPSNCVIFFIDWREGRNLGQGKVIQELDGSVRVEAASSEISEFDEAVAANIVARLFRNSE
jgi:hypothetical protein